MNTPTPTPDPLEQALTAWARAAQAADDGFTERLVLRLPARRTAPQDESLLAQSWRWYAYGVGASLLLWTAQRLDNASVWGVLGAVALAGALAERVGLLSRR